MFHLSQRLVTYMIYNPRQERGCSVSFLSEETRGRRCSLASFRSDYITLHFRIYLSRISGSYVYSDQIGET